MERCWQAREPSTVPEGTCHRAPEAPANSSGFLWPFAYLPGQVPFLAPSSPDQTSPLQLSLHNGNSLMDFATPSPPPPVPRLLQEGGGDLALRLETSPSSNTGRTDFLVLLSCKGSSHLHPQAPAPPSTSCRIWASRWTQPPEAVFCIGGTGTPNGGGVGGLLGALHEVLCESSS